MKVLNVTAIALALTLSGCNQKNATEQNDPPRTELTNSLEYKVALIDAEKNIPESDLTISRAKQLLDATEPVFGLSKDRIADIAAKSRELAKERGLYVKITELLDWALIACDKKCTETQLVEFMSTYIMSRATTGQTHHQAIHGLVILNNLTKPL
jgi:hypothetical protein